ncbi:hypothetical protein [Rhizobium leguminosarum]|uniref:hypothetical protein n=1 Tax=Rhizobium leguminosarum TaxID=384 RepID=UPI0021BBBC05|nr:hypothetical protein [Rhizobium leguminosarum]
MRQQNRKSAITTGIFIACLSFLLQHNVESAKNLAPKRILPGTARDRGPLGGIDVRHNLMACFRTVTGLLMREMFKRFSTGSAAATPDFWNDADVGDVSTAARSLYGQHAKTAAAWCALCARYDGRSGDFTFWVGVFKHLGTEEIVDFQKQRQASQ